MPNSSVNNDGLNYTTIESFIEWVSSNFAGLLSNDDVNNLSPNTLPAQRVIKRALLYAEGRVNSFLKRRGYKVPLSPEFEQSISVLEIHAYNIASFELYGRKGITKERYYKYTKTIEDLRAIANGDEPLPNCNAPLRSSAKVSHGSVLPSVFSQSKREHADSI